jgi:hypothetical protein
MSQAVRGDEGDGLFIQDVRTAVDRGVDAALGVGRGQYADPRVRPK